MVFVHGAEKSIGGDESNRNSDVFCRRIVRIWIRSPPSVNLVRNFNDPSSFCFFSADRVNVGDDFVSRNVRE